MADSIEHVISYWILFEKFQSPALGGFAIISHWLPFLLFSIWSGALADRFDPRRIIQARHGAIHWRIRCLGRLVSCSMSSKCGMQWFCLIVHGFAGVLWAPALPAPGARHRGTRATPQRGSAPRHRALPGAPGRTGGRKRTDAHRGLGARYPAEHADLSAAATMALDGPLRAALQGNRTPRPRAPCAASRTLFRPLRVVAR